MRNPKSAEGESTSAVCSAESEDKLLFSTRGQRPSMIRAEESTYEQTEHTLHQAEA